MIEMHWAVLVLTVLIVFIAGLMVGVSIPFDPNDKESDRHDRTLDE